MEFKKTIVILGNGFDLDLGLKTSYGSFYNATLKDYDGLNNNMYINRMMTEGCWYDIEGFIRNEIIEWDKRGRNPNEKEHLHHFWLISQSFLYGYFQKQEEVFPVQIKKDSCAYSFLMKLRKEALVFSFNYTDPYKYVSESITSKHECAAIKHIHGDLSDGYNGKSSLLLGVDTSVSLLVQNDNYIKIMIKRLHDDYKNTNLINELNQADRVIFFGHSFGVTDSDYFMTFFRRMVDNTLNVNDIIVVTKDITSELSIKENIKSWEWGIDKSKIPFHRIDFVHTSDGIDNFNFQSLLQSL